MSVRFHLLKSKLHRATVTEADLEYEGSITIDAELMRAARLIENEQVHVWNVTRGTRLTTYVIRGEEGKREICVNGAAAHLCQPRDRVIISAFAEVPAAEAEHWRPAVVLMGEHNEIAEIVDHEVAGRRHAV